MHCAAGGLVGFNKQLWQSDVSTTGVAVTFHLQSPDGDEGALVLGLASSLGRE